MVGILLSYWGDPFFQGRTVSFREDYITDLYSNIPLLPNILEVKIWPHAGEVDPDARADDVLTCQSASIEVLETLQNLENSLSSSRDANTFCNARDAKKTILRFFRFLSASSFEAKNLNLGVWNSDFFWGLLLFFGVLVWSLTTESCRCCPQSSRLDFSQKTEAA